MTSQIRSAIDFYDRHPISAQTILAKLGAARGTLEGLQPDDLFPHDQDHYGGLAANDALAKCAGIGVGTQVVDLCAGLGGPARYLAHRYAVISQEALLHVPDLGRTFREAHRVLCPGGRLAFTNWTVRQPLSEPQRQLLWDGMAAATLIGIDQYTELLRGAGFAIEAVEDETDSWGVILAERLRMYERLRGEAEQAGAPAGHDDFYKSYVLFVDLVQRKVMGGARFTAVKAM